MAATIALTPDRRWDIELAGLVPVVRDAGFTSLGIGARRADATARAAYDLAGLDCHEVMALVVTDDAEATSSWAARLAEALRAPWVNTVFLAPMSTETAVAVMEVIDAIRRAASTGQRQLVPAPPATGSA